MEPNAKKAKIVTFHVTMEVDDGGEMEENCFRDAIIRGLDMARAEGHLTRLGDMSTEVKGYFVQHTGNIEVPESHERLF